MGGASDDVLLSTARSDQLDIAIDLKGFTEHARLSMFAKRVAPLQVSFLGYPGSMGSKCYDYLVADRVLIPESERKYYSERILYMPYSYQPNSLESRLAGHSLSRADLGLPDNCFVFASFNASYKIQPAEFSIWMNLLRRIPNSVIWIYASCDLVCHNLSHAAVEQGVSPKRLIFASSARLSIHLARMQSADLFLDTFNVNAHTTAADAISVGVPVLTKPGRSFTARVCASLLTALEMPELIAKDETDYEDKAFYYATNPSAYHVMRLKLSKKRDVSPLYDANAYVQAFENGLSRIYLQALQNKISDTSAW
jgi:predicted O-linked N-acetylglucosamine transferase (SPINDLY family)